MATILDGIKMVGPWKNVQLEFNCTLVKEILIPTTNNCKESKKNYAMTFDNLASTTSSWTDQE